MASSDVPLYSISVSDIVLAGCRSATRDLKLVDQTVMTVTVMGRRRLIQILNGQTSLTLHYWNRAMFVSLSYGVLSSRSMHQLSRTGEMS